MRNSEIKLGLIGFGSIGRQVRQLLLQENFKAEHIYIFDDRQNSEVLENYYTFWEFLEPTFSQMSFLPSIGYLSHEIRAQVIDRLRDKELNIFSYIHSTAYVNSTASIGVGSIIYPMCNIGNDVSIGNGVIANNSCTISHGSLIKNNAYLSPGVVLSGDVEIGDNTFVGSGSVFSNDVKVGRDCCVGIASCITEDIPDGSFVIGNPMQFKSHIDIS